VAWQLLNVSRITIFKQAKAGRIPSFRIGTSRASIQKQRQIGCESSNMLTL